MLQTLMILQVLVGGPEIVPRFEKIFLWTHQDPHATAAFVQIEVAPGFVLHLTAGHYLWAQEQDGGQPAQLRRAADVRVGDSVWVVDAQERGVNASTVTAVGVQLLGGLYNPHTRSGSIIINGVAASTFTDVLPPSEAAHTAATLPAWLLYQLLPSQLIASALNDAVLRITFSQSWMHAFLLQAVSMLQVLVK